MGIFKLPHIRRSHFTTTIVSTVKTSDLNHLIGENVNDILLFDDSTDEDLVQGRTILPRHYYLFVGNKDGEPQFKPYEPDQYRIVITTYKDIIRVIDSIG